MRLREITFCALMVVAVCGAKAKPSGDSREDSTRCPRVGLVLSGGGAKGAAHIGVLKYMEEIGIPVSYVTGTSMGSIIGGIYALGYTPDEMEELISGIDWPLYITGKSERRFLSQRRRKAGDMLLVNIPFGKFTRRDELEMSAVPLGAVEGDNLLNLFNCLSIGFQDSMSFAELPIPFACVATDLMTGKSRVLHGGEFGRAIRTSMSIPIFFSPIPWEGHLLADGGLVNNFPVDVCREMGADIIIGLEVYSDLVTDPDDLRSVGKQLQQYLSIITNRGLDDHRQLCDIYVKPDVTGVNMLSFNKEAIAELVRRGYEAAKSHEAEFLQLKARLESHGPLPVRRNYATEHRERPRVYALNATDSLIIDDMQFSGLDKDENRFLSRAVSVFYGKKVTLHDVEELIHTFQGTGMFHSVNFKTIPAEEKGHYILKVEVTPELPYRMGVGLRYDSEESAGLLIHSSWNALKLKGFNARVDLGLKYNYWLEGHVGWLIMGLGDVGFDARVHKAVFNCHNKWPNTANLIERKLRLGVSTVHFSNVDVSLGISQDINHDNNEDNTITPNVYATGVFLKVNTDTRDAADFATKGLNLDFEANVRRNSDRLFKRGESTVTDLAFSIEGYLSSGSRLTFVPYLHSRVMWGYDGRGSWYNNLVGGSVKGRYLSQQLPFVGINGVIQTEPMTIVYGLQTRYFIFDKFYLAIHANMLAHSSRNEMRNIFADGYSATHYFGYAASISYSSLLGPIQLMVGSNTFDDKLYGYLNIGFQF